MNIDEALQLVKYEPTRAEEWAMEIMGLTQSVKARNKRRDSGANLNGCILVPDISSSIDTFNQFCGKWMAQKDDTFRYIKATTVRCVELGLDPYTALFFMTAHGRLAMFLVVFGEEEKPNGQNQD